MDSQRSLFCSFFMAGAYSISAIAERRLMFDILAAMQVRKRRAY